MAVPSYTEDLTDITLAESVTNWTRVGVAGNPGVGADYAQQGTLCVDKQVSAGDGGLLYNNLSAITLGAGDHVWVWHFAASPGITQTIQNKGAFIIVGSGATAYCQYHVAGNDTFGASGRVARCYPIDYSVRTANASAPYRTLVGSPVANPQYFGGGLVTTATSRTNLGVDAIRYGTGGYLTAGELLSAGDGTDNPCTFAGFNTQNDALANRWGILTDIGGSYELQGRFVIGQNNSKVATLCRFRSTDVNIIFPNTLHAAADFTQIIIDHVSTRCEWTNINLTALGTSNRGRVTVNSANPTFLVTGGSWAGLGPTTLRSNSTLTGVNIRACDTITMNGATLTDCIISSSFAAVAVLSTNLSSISGCQFTSGGTGHAIEITTPGTYTFSGNLFDGYGASGTTNAAIYNNSGGAVTINVSGGDTPSIRNGAGASTTVNNTVIFRVTNVPANAEVRIFRNSDQVELAGVERINDTSPSNSSVDSDPDNVGKFRLSYSHQEANLPIYIVVIDFASQVYYQNFTLTSSQAEQSLLVSLIPDRQYSNPA